MSIRKFNITTFKQNLKTSHEKKSNYGEIFTPFALIKQMLEMIPDECFLDENAKWLDLGAGTGYFSMYIYWKLNNSLYNTIKDDNKRHNHIIQNMIYMIEIQECNVLHLREIFGNNANIIQGEVPYILLNKKFDYVVGNPPYNMNGIKKVPTNNKKDKKKDGKTIWIDFLKFAFSLLVENGKVIMITPSLWLKPDKAKMYDYMMKYKIEKMVCLSNTKTNQIFSGEAQTPTCYFVASNEKSNNILNIYDIDREKYIEYLFEYNKPIPVYGANIINKLQPYVKKYGYLQIKKTNEPSLSSAFLPIKNNEYQFLNIKTAILDGLSPKLITHYSNIKQQYYGVKKLILPHKMYGFPYLDLSGNYGISHRDNYVIVSENTDILLLWKDFLSTKTALYLFECTRYRMKYLEKYIFPLIPNIVNIPNFPLKINDESLFTFFNFDKDDIANIMKLHKKEYTFSYC